MNADYRQMQEAEEAQMAFEVELCKRIKAGTTTYTDGDYVAHRLGLTNYMEKHNEMG